MKNREKKVLLIGSDLSVKGGITTVISSFLEHRFDNISILFLPTYVEGSINKRITFFINSMIKYVKKLIKNEFNIAHVHMSYKGSFYRKFIVIKLGKLFGKKIILHLHGSEFEVFYNSSNKMVKGLIKNLFKSSDCIVVLGEKWNKVIAEISPKANIKIFNNSVKIPEVNAKWNSEKFNILFLGVLIKRKGIYELIEAIKILKEDGIIYKYNLNFIIGGTGKEEVHIKNLILKYGLSECVQMLGWVNGQMKEELLMKSQLFILPSYNEGLPMAILEAMSYGIPTISTNVGSISELVIDNETGKLIEEITPVDIVNAIKEEINDLEGWKYKSKKCKSIIQDKFSEDIYFNKFENLYNNI